MPNRRFADLNLNVARADACRAPGYRFGPYRTGEHSQDFICERTDGHAGPHAWAPRPDETVTWPVGISLAELMPVPDAEERYAQCRGAGVWTFPNLDGRLPCNRCGQSFDWERPDGRGDAGPGRVPEHNERVSSAERLRAAQYADAQRILAYTYEADNHCVHCAARRFGVDEAGAPTGNDNEGNPIGIVLESDEWWNGGEYEETLACGTCYATLATHRNITFCACGDGCLDNQCRSCMEDEEGPEDEHYEDEHYEDSGCDCENCIAAAHYDPATEVYMPEPPMAVSA